MVVGRVLRTKGCTSCRAALLRHFISEPGISLRVSPVRFPRQAVQIQSGPGRRPLSNLSNFPNEKGLQESDELLGSGVPEEESKELNPVQEDEPVEREEDVEESPVPWYLQVESPQKPLKPLSERQRIPDLPESPPAVLQPLLQQISVDLGLDDLGLLDLRALDPPPALGANLLMIIGTARSEKHLHVSADRLCRWLRSTYKLRPDADGLLGRNELKLKLKRKAKKAKLMGNSAVDNADDGMRTGWVCVDVGVVESAETTSLPEQSDFVGFGRKTDGTRIVVQMLTEEKRYELDLERLWGGILQRATREEPDELDGNTEAESTNSNIAQTELNPSLPIDGRKNITSQTVSGTREFHTLTRRLQMTEGPSIHSSAAIPPLSPSTDSLPKIDPQNLYDSVVQSIAMGEYDVATRTLFNMKDHIPELQNDRWRHFLLEQLRVGLQNVSRDQAINLLGAGSSDYSSTPFLSCFYQTLSDYPSTPEVEARIWLLCYAQALDHPGYNASSLVDFFTQFKLYGVEISLTSYVLLLRGVLRRNKGGATPQQLPRFALRAAMDILQTMHARGLNILDEQVLVELQEAVSPDETESPHEGAKFQDKADTFGLPCLPTSPLQNRLHILIRTLDLPCFNDESRLRLLELYWRNHHWVEFWDIWRMAPKRSQPQSPVMYAYMFSRVAQAGHQRGCMNVLRTWVPEMSREDPPVALEGQVAQAVMACIKVAQPNVEAAAPDEAEGEWVSLWRKCTTSV